MNYVTICPKQRLFYINSETVNSGALNILAPTWQKASRSLNGAAFKLYLLLASVANGAPCVLVAEEVAAALGISQASYWKAITELAAAGFIIQRERNQYDFYTTALLN